MKLFIRILTALFASTGIFAGVISLAVCGWWGTILAGNGDGAGADSFSELLGILVVGLVLWILPMTAFVFMLLGSFNRLKGIGHRIGYGYSLVVLFILAGLFFNQRHVQFYHTHLWKWMSLACIIMACLWGYAFREKSAGH